MKSESHQSEATKKALGKLNQSALFLGLLTQTSGGWEEIVDIAIMDSKGQVCFESIIQPRDTFTDEFLSLTLISQDLLDKAIPWPEAFNSLNEKIGGKTVGVMDLTKDMRYILDMNNQYDMNNKVPNIFFGVLELLSTFVGEWDVYHNSYRMFSTQQACEKLDIGYKHMTGQATKELEPLTNMHELINKTPYVDYYIRASEIAGYTRKITKKIAIQSNFDIHGNEPKNRVEHEQTWGGQTFIFYPSYIPQKDDDMSLSGNLEEIVIEIENKPIIGNGLFIKLGRDMYRFSFQNPSNWEFVKDWHLPSKEAPGMWRVTKESGIPGPHNNLYLCTPLGLLLNGDYYIFQVEYLGDGQLVEYDIRKFNNSFSHLLVEKARLVNLLEAWVGYASVSFGCACTERAINLAKEHNDEPKSILLDLFEIANQYALAKQEDFNRFGLPFNPYNYRYNPPTSLPGWKELDSLIREAKEVAEKELALRREVSLSIIETVGHAYDSLLFSHSPFNAANRARTTAAWSFRMELKSAGLKIPPFFEITSKNDRIWFAGQKRD